MQNDRTWAVFPIKSMLRVNDDPVDFYFIVNCKDGRICSFFSFLGQLPSLQEVKSAFKKARKADGGWASEILIQKEDPCEGLFLSALSNTPVRCKTVPTTQLDYLKDPVQESFELFQSGGKEPGNPEGLESVAQARAGIPESYDPCYCNSGKKYKFCCKVIAREVIEAMCAIEEGKIDKAIEWIQIAKKKVGDTAEIVCREAIIYGTRTEEDYLSRLTEAIDRFPEHPRLHYLMGIEHKAHGRYADAEAAYLAAVDRIPRTDKYRLNETWNNLGTVYFEMGDFLQAKNAWEKALGYMPIDDTCKKNLVYFIYENDDLTPELRSPSPFIVKYLR